MHATILILSLLNSEMNRASLRLPNVRKYNNDTNLETLGSCHHHLHTENTDPQSHIKQ